MTPAPGDTDAGTLELMAALYVRMTPEEKLGRVRDLTLAVNRLALAGIRAHHPEDGERELLLRLARRRLGADVVDRAYSTSGERNGP